MVGGIPADQIGVEEDAEILSGLSEFENQDAIENIYTEEDQVCDLAFTYRQTHAGGSKKVQTLTKKGKTSY